MRPTSLAMPMFEVPFMRSTEQNKFRHREDERLSVAAAKRRSGGVPPRVTLQFLREALRITGQLHVAAARDRLSSHGAGRLDGALPIDDLCAAVRGKFLLRHARNKCKRKTFRRNG